MPKINPNLPKYKTKMSFISSSPASQQFLSLKPFPRESKFALNHFSSFIFQHSPSYLTAIDWIMSSEAKEIYHERQRLQFCLLHALNNLFQYKDAYTRGDLDIIAGKLNLDDPQKSTWTPLSSIFKPHHNALTGNYDINVLIAALEERDKRVLWHDKRHGASSISLDGPENKLFGIILNVPVKRYAGLWRSRHWIALRRVESVWYNLDSDLSAPCPFQNRERLIEFLDSVILNGGEVILVMNGEE